MAAWAWYWPRRSRDRAVWSTSTPSLIILVSHSVRSCSSSGTSSPDAVYRASRRAWCSSMSASSPAISGSAPSGRAAEDTVSWRMSRIASSASEISPVKPSLKIRYSTCSTARASPGVSNRSPVMVRLAREIRCAIVASGTRKARAICAVVSPPTARSVSAMADAGLSAGWQQRLRSSSVSSDCSVGPCGGSSPARSSRLRRAASDRWRSISLRPATRSSHALASSGGSSGQCRTASIKASWTASSAVAKSAPRRTRTPRTCGASVRTRSFTASWSTSSLPQVVRLTRRSSGPRPGTAAPRATRRWGGRRRRVRRTARPRPRRRAPGTRRR